VTGAPRFVEIRAGPETDDARSVALS